MRDDRPAVRDFEIREDKVTRFLLAPDRMANKGRAKFFFAFGFSAAEPDMLVRALLKHPHHAHAFRYQTGRVSELRLIYNGLLDCPDGRQAHVRTVWNYDLAPVALFITAFPLDRPGR